MADVSPSRRTFVRGAVDAKLFGVHEEDVQTLVCPDESADECAVVVRDYSKSAAEDVFEVPDCLGVSHQGVSNDGSRGGTVLVSGNERRGWNYYTAKTEPDWLTTYACDCDYIITPP